MQIEENIIDQEIKTIKQHLHHNLTSQNAEKISIKIFRILYQNKVNNEYQIQKCLKIVATMFNMGYCYLFTKNTELMKTMMNHFNRLARKLENNLEVETEIEFRMLFVLSLIAEITKGYKKIQFPFTRKFLINFFLIDEKLLQYCPHKEEVMAIIAVIYLNLSEKIMFLKKMNLLKNLKFALLKKYFLISQDFTFKLFNHAILNLANDGINFTAAQFNKYKVLIKISNFFSMSQTQNSMTKIKRKLFRKKDKQITNNIISCPPQMIS